jgi:hypothetical protein
MQKIIGECFFLLVRSYDGSPMKVCGILSPCRQAGELEQGLEAKGAATGRRGAQQAQWAPLRPVAGADASTPVPVRRPPARAGEHRGECPNPIRRVPTADQCGRRQSPQGHSVWISRELGRRALGAVPQIEVAQDSLDDGGAVDQADDCERAAATPANQSVTRSLLLCHLVDLGNRIAYRIRAPAIP